MSDPYTFFPCSTQYYIAITSLRICLPHYTVNPSVQVVPNGLPQSPAHGRYSQDLTTEAPDQSLLNDGLMMNLMMKLMHIVDYSQVFLDGGNARLPRVSLLFSNLFMPHFCSVITYF